MEQRRVYASDRSGHATWYLPAPVAEHDLRRWIDLLAYACGGRIPIQASQPSSAIAFRAAAICASFVDKEGGLVGPIG